MKSSSAFLCSYTVKERTHEPAGVKWLSKISHHLWLSHYGENDSGVTTDQVLVEEQLPKDDEPKHDSSVVGEQRS